MARGKAKKGEIQSDARSVTAFEGLPFAGGEKENL